MMIVSTISLAIAAFMILQTILGKADFFSPGRLYLFVHSLTLGIAFLALHPAMTPFQPLTSLVYFGSGASFLLGTWIAGRLAKFGGAPPERFADMSRYNWKWHWVFSFVICAIFVWGTMTAYFGAGGFPMLAENKAAVLYKFFRVKWIASITLGLGGLAMAFFYMTLFQPGRKPVFLRAGLWLTVASCILFSMALSRVGLMYFTVFALVYYHYGVRRVAFYKLAILSVFIMTTFLSLAYLKLSDIEKKTSLDLKPIEVVEGIMILPYVYLANNYWNLDYALNPPNSLERHPPTYGFSQLAGFLDMMILPGGNLGAGIRHAGTFEGMFHEQSIKLKGLNTIGYQWGLYKDFGVPGVLTAPFLFGLLIGILYWRVRRHPTPLNLSMYGTLAFFIAYSWFTAMWELVGFMMSLVYTFVACGLSQLAAPKQPLPPE